MALVSVMKGIVQGSRVQPLSISSWRVCSMTWAMRSGSA